MVILRLNSLWIFARSSAVFAAEYWLLQSLRSAAVSAGSKQISLLAGLRLRAWASVAEKPTAVTTANETRAIENHLIVGRNRDLVTQAREWPAARAHRESPAGSAGNAARNAQR